MKTPELSLPILVGINALLALLFAPMTVEGQTLVASIPIGPQPALTQPSKMLLNPANHKLYVMGAGGAIAVVDAATNSTMTHIANTNGGKYGMFLSRARNEIYLIGGTIQVIDCGTDTIVRTFTPPPVPGSISVPFFPPQYASGGYNPVTNILYLTETYEISSDINVVNALRLVAIDGSTGAELGVLASSGDPTLPFLGAQIVNPATNKIYAIVSGSDTSVGGFEVYDGATNTRIAGSLFALPQATDTLRGHFQSYHINPADNSIWIASNVQTSVLAADGTVMSTPARTDFYRIDGVTNQLSTYSTFGLFSGLGFDPASGRYIGTGGCIPTTGVAPPDLQKDACSLANTNGFNNQNLVAFDPASPSQLIAVNTTGFQFSPDFTNGVNCGLGYFQFVGADVSGGNLYWALEDCTNTHPAEVVVAKADFSGTPAATLPPSLSAHWVTNLPTKLTGRFDVPPFSNIATDAGTHQSFFLTTNENSLTAIDPSIPSVTSQLLGNHPGGVAVNSATNTIYVGDVNTGTLNSFDGATDAARPQIQAGAGPYVAINQTTNQLIVAGPSDVATDPGQVRGAFLLDGASESVIRPLQAAATSPVAVNPVTNIGYFANNTEWYAVDLGTGMRTFTGSDLSGNGTDVCQITGVGVNSVSNQIYVSGKCLTNGQTLAVFDGATNTLLQQTSLGAFVTAGSNFGFGKLGVNSKTNKIYVENIRVLNFGGSLNFEDPAIEVFDGASLAHLTTVKGPRGQIAINTVTNIVYACAGYCAAIDGRTDTYIGPFGTPGANQPAVAVNEATNLVYIAADRADSDPLGVAPGGFVNVFKGVPPGFSISGSVVSSAGGGQAGITVAIKGPVSATALTDANGLFTLPRVTPGDYTITPIDAGFVFTPASQLLTVVDANVSGVSFTAAPAFNISGQVVDSGGVGLPGMTVINQGPINATAVTDAAGRFTLTGLPSGTYTIVPTTPAFLYTPAAQNVTVAAGNITGVSFTAVPTFNIVGQVLNSNGAGLNGVTVTSQGGISTNTVTDANGRFALTGLPAGTYTITPTSPGVIFGPVSQTFKVSKSDILGVTFTVIPPIAITNYTLSPYTTIGAGVITSGVITLNQAAPPGGVTVALSSSDSKPAKFPSTVTVAQGQTSATFNVQGNGVSASTTVTLKASYQGSLAPLGTSATASLTVAPTDSLKITKATFSTSTKMITITGTSTNPSALLNVFLASNNQNLGAMVNQGGGNYTFQLLFTSGTPSSVNVKSNLGGSTGQGISIVP